jgi:hypothetical protein
MRLQAILSSYEGQNVTAIEIAGRPNLDTSKLMPLLQQHAGEPFAREKVDQSIATLKSAGKFSEVQLQIDPEANGVRVLMIVEPAVWFGIFEFPGAEGSVFQTGANRKLSSAGALQRRRRAAGQRRAASLLPTGRLF